jgi:hypothetical protein
MAELGLNVRINPIPSEIADGIPFDQDRTHGAYDRDYANRRSSCGCTCAGRCGRCRWSSGCTLMGRQERANRDGDHVVDAFLARCLD